ncbi:MAG: MFS transporter [Candidatus Krumholzibacteriia bacterium]
MAAPASGTERKDPIKEIVQPFIDLVDAPRALWGINLAYFLEGWVYFGMLGYLAMHFSDFVFKGIENPDIQSHHMVMVLTAGITISMFFFGAVADKFGIRRTLLTAFCFLLAGRVVWSAAPTVFPQPGLWSHMHLMTMGGILLVVIGYGMYQPAAYAGVRKFTNPKTAAMGYAMLYALMNLGGWLPSFFSYVRERIGITGSFWVYTGLTLVALVATWLILTRKVERRPSPAPSARRRPRSRPTGSPASSRRRCR